LATPVAGRYAAAVSEANCDSPEVLIWCNADHAALVREVMHLLPDVSVAGLGGPRRGELADLAHELAVAPSDDLRQMLTERMPRFVLLASDGGYKPADLEPVLAAGGDLLAITPVAASTDQVLEQDPSRPGRGRMLQLPLLRCSPGYLAAAEPETVIGRVDAMQLRLLAPPGTGGMAARLTDAFDLVVHLAGVPDLVDAGLSGPLTAVPDDLRGLTGHIAAHARYGGGTSVSVLLSDRAPLWRRSVTVIGRDATLLLHDNHYRLIFHRREAENAEATDQPAEQEQVAETPARPAELIAEQWRWWMRQQIKPAPVDRRAVLACAQTALLSCRTGQPESPHTLLRMGV
jgi:hypothetical protein